MRNCIDCGKPLIPGAEWPDNYQIGKIYRHKACNTIRRTEVRRVEERAAKRLFNEHPGPDSKWRGLPLERRQAELAYQRELEATESTLIPHPASPPVPKEYDPATAGGMKIVMTRQVRRAFQRRWGLAVHARDTRCIISGASLETDACHVKPVKFCTNIDEARDLNNGVVLRTDLHRLFDRGYFTWDANGWIVPAFGFRMNKQIPCVRWKHTFTPEQQYYIAWHRENKFKPNVMQEKRNVHTHSGPRSKQSAPRRGSDLATLCDGSAR